MKELYSFDLYWHNIQRLKGFPTLEHRTGNDLSDGRVDRWMAVVEEWSPSRGRTVEVGCGHGVLLAQLSKKGYDCIGVEIDEKVAAWTTAQTGVPVYVGIFPDVALPQCDLFMTFDVIEHSATPAAFIRAAANLLNPGGAVIIQTPIDHGHCHPPFPGIFANIFDDLEHLFVFTSASIRRLAAVAGLEAVSEATGIRERDIIVLRKKK